MFRSIHPDEDRGGFVLLAVVLVIGVAALAVTAAFVTARRDRIDADIEVKAVRAGALADAGLTRISAALAAEDDPLVPALFGGGKPLSWRLAGQEVELSLVLETGKVDLNAGDAALIANVMRAAAPDEATASRLLARLDAVRRSRRPLEAVRGLLEPRAQTSELARNLEAVFTVWTQMRGVDPKAAPALVLRNLPGLHSGEAALLEQAIATRSHADLSPFVARFGHLLGASRPIYRAQARTRVDGVTVTREALVLHNSVERQVSIIIQRDLVE
jgi:hypothetical protein